MTFIVIEYCLICHNSDINVYAQNIVKTLNALTETCVPKKIVTFRSSDPPWLTTAIKKHIRKRKKAYRKAKQTNLQTHWVKFKHLPYKFYVLGQIGLSKQCRPRSDCF